MNVGILASGDLGFSTCSLLLENGLQPIFLFTDNRSLALKSLFTLKKIPVFSGNPREGKGLNFLKNLVQDIHLIFSINYIFLLDDYFISYPKFGCVNIHGSLLPKYRGRTPHVWAIINNEKLTGITVHFIDSGCDTGSVILQEPVQIEEHFTGADILDVFRLKYPALILKTIDLFRNGIATSTPQDEKKATYFGKRSQEDGKIDWNWQRERLFNWIRAQADPYPGAYTFYESHKLIIDAIEFTETGFNWEIVNGTILNGGKFPEVKTPNGVIKVAIHRSDLIFEKGKILQ